MSESGNSDILVAAVVVEAVAVEVVVEDAVAVVAVAAVSEEVAVVDVAEEEVPEDFIKSSKLHVIVTWMIDTVQLTLSCLPVKRFQRHCCILVE